MYVSVSVSAVPECSPWWYVFVSVSGAFWHFSLLCTELPPFEYNFTRLPLYLVIYFYFPLYHLVASDRGWSLGSGRKALMSSRWKRFGVQCMEVGTCRSLAGVTGWLALFLVIQVCW